MPELPEVETVKRGLEKEIVEAKITRTHIGDTKVFQFPLSQLDTLIGQRFENLSRRGKYLVFSLSKSILIVHLGMTGQLTLRKPDRQDSEKFLRHKVTGLQRIRQHTPDKHTHLQVSFVDGRVLMYRDTRKFGKIFLLPKSENFLTDFFSKLGMEPLSDDYSFDFFQEYLGNRKAQIKPVLLDQAFIAGIGNIYADEALFEARVHPGKRIRYLTRREKQKIFEAIPLVLEKGINYGGTTLRDYVNSDGQEGTHQEFLNVYGRNGEACHSCGSEIKKTVIGQRGTHFCPSCQKR